MQSVRMTVGGTQAYKSGPLSGEGALHVIARLRIERERVATRSFLV